MNSPAVVFSLTAALAAQVPTWTLTCTPAVPFSIIQLTPFGDYNGDGIRDCLVTIGYVFPPATAVRIVSGADGSTLYEHLDFTVGGEGDIGAWFVGAMDQDGHPDAATVEDNPYSQLRWLKVWSPWRQQMLWQVTGSWAGRFGDRGVLGNLDVNGDGRPDIVVATTSANESDVYVYDNSGVLIRRIPARAFGFV